MRCKRRFLVFSFVILGVLVFSTGSMAVLSSSPNARSVGQFNDTLPTADGQITATEQGYCDHVQLSMDIYGVLFVSDFSEIPDVFHERTVTIDFYTARNDTGTNGFIYFGVVISEVPYLANVELNSTGDLQPPANVSAIALRFDNDGSNTIDDYEDMKVVMQGNSTFVVAMDQYWNSTDENYQQDVEDGGPDPGNITAFNMTHSDTSAQGNLGNLTMEMIMPIDSGELEDGPLLDPYTNISIDYAAWVNMKDFDWMEDLGEYRTTQFYGSTSNTYLNFDDATNFYPLNPNDLFSTNLEQNFNINGTITDLEKPDCNHVLFSSVDVYRVGYMGAYAVDVYAANNDTMLYMGIIIPEIPYWADVDLSSTWDQQAPGNLTGITVQFDNNDDDVVNNLEDMKIVMIGNSSLKVGWDQYYDASYGHYTEDTESHDGPPNPGDLVAYGITHSNDAAQSNIGDLSTEIMMPLSDDVNGTDGGGLSDTVGFSIGYVGLHKSYIEGPEEEGDQGCGLVGSIADIRTHPLFLDDGDDGNGASAPVTIDASTFEDLLIEPNPVSEFSFVLLTLMSALLVVTVLSVRKMVSRRQNANRESSI